MAVPTPRGAAARHRVVVTGLGAATAAGWGVAAFRDAALRARASIGPLTRFPAEGQRTGVAGEVPAPATRGESARWRRFSNADQFALFSALEAMRQAGLFPSLEGRAAGVFFASSTGGLFESEQFYARLTGDTEAPADRAWLASHQLSAPAEAIARRLRIAGPVETVSSACASAGLALEQALRSVRSGEVDVAIAGGSDGLALTTFAGFNALRAMDDRPCRPFHADRRGMSLGEGAAVLVFESLAHAEARGAQPLAEVLGAGASCDAAHMTAPHDTGAFAAAAMRAAIADADLIPDDISYVNAHATGTPLNDAAEFAALRLVFGDRASALPVEATKGLVGHLLGASGAIEAVSTVLGLGSETIHATPGYGTLDPATPVDLVRDRARPSPGIRYALSASLGFGGANAAVLFGRWTGA